LLQRAWVEKGIEPAKVLGKIFPWVDIDCAVPLLLQESFWTDFVWPVSFLSLYPPACEFGSHQAAPGITFFAVLKRPCVGTGGYIQLELRNAAASVMTGLTPAHLFLVAFKSLKTTAQNRLIHRPRRIFSCCRTQATTESQRLSALPCPGAPPSHLV
jgi:hypothetical protein